MIYWLWLRPKGRDARIFRDSILPGLVPEHVLDLCSVRACEDLGLCRTCGDQASKCHVIEAGTGRKFCTILFHDAVKPPWSPSDAA